ncbi:CDP-glycerol glycerophosphotransferase family protein [Bacillus altitudinis]|uniref:CDP-glycerol glycerophosphotransferase family protein n=1 Tax=Bacillus altitudinis TaxID=293387 RepID=UPI0024A8E309|nr:CDP-glycerol glycerophosphotransferase family protein [Bacillus altitudinis]WHF26625.1 CDP-glycerol glycerophosphotransferase family protein [Bacillus altitudinis]
MYKLYHNFIEILNLDEHKLVIYIDEIEKLSTFEFKELNVNDSKWICKIDVKDQMIFESTIDHSNEMIYLYAKDQNLYILKESSDMIQPKQIHSIEINNQFEKIYVKQLGLDRYGLYSGEKELLLFSGLLNVDEINQNYKMDLAIDGEKKRFVDISFIIYGLFHFVITYDCQNKELNVRKILFDVMQEHKEIEVTVNNRNQIKILNKVTEQKKIVNFRLVPRYQPLKIFGKDTLEQFKEDNILNILVINKQRYYIYVRTNGVYLVRGNPYLVTKHTSRLRIFSLFNSFYVYGRLTHYAYNSDQKYEYLYIRNSDHQLAKFTRPFRKIKFLKRYGFFKISLNDLDLDSRIHNNLFVGNDHRIIHSLRLKKRDKKVKTYITKKNGDKLQVLRTNLFGNVTSTIIPYSEEYSLFSKVKIKVASILSSFYKDKKYGVNLFFEKKSDKADESAIRVYDYVQENCQTDSKNYFILNKKSSAYPALKAKYGKGIIPKYSLRHYLSIFNASYFISSELSNHVLNDRLYIDHLRERIMSVPLVFLQHGIMFAKPVDNPMAFGFHKDKNQYNIYKSVISSELEAGEFYKMNYDRDDLILTGLATFDHAKLVEGADKIAFMPTYRYWEEGLIYTNRIEETSYYRVLIKIIKSFEEAGLLDRLLIVPHNKFSQYVYQNLPEYKHIISDNPSEALKVSKVFITDYSSAIYDAQYRGAYPIFYWEEKDYLIRQYKAIPPVNEENAPGPIAYNTQDLIRIVKHAIDHQYVVEDEYKEKYLKINSFNDNQNTKRITDFLKEHQII